VLVAAAVVATAGASAMVALAYSGPTPGEVYRVWLDGREIDVSRSAADDTFPAVSPDGRRVAFISDRGGGGLHLYVARTDGRGLERVSSALKTDQSLLQHVAWSPDSKLLAVALPGGVLYVIGPGERQRVVAASPPILLAPAWSPDGHMIALDIGTYRDPGTEVVSATGKRSWHVRGRRVGSGRLAGWGWSATGRLAVRRGATIRVYSENGRLQMSVRGRSYSWSLEGRRLATVTSDRLEVRTLSGRLLFRKSVPGLHRNQHNGLIWADKNRVLIGGIGGTSSVHTISVDVASGRTSAGNNRYFGTLSPDRRLVAGLANIHGGYALTVSRLDGIRVRTLAHRAPCPDLIEGDIQWLPDSRSLVYDFRCEPNH
jgi:dipeptidyl aminopeptidase/acylaminoacyl peptidase